MTDSARQPKPLCMGKAAWAIALISFSTGCDCSGIAGYRSDAGEGLGGGAAGGSEASGGGASGTGGGASGTGGGAGSTGGGANSTGGGNAGSGGGSSVGGGNGSGGGSQTGGGSGGGLTSSTCPIGVADGCCPLLVHGGTDPDCHALACTPLGTSAIIDLVDDGFDGWKGPTGLAWTGDSLVIARTDSHVDAGASEVSYEVVFEQRALDGGLMSSRRTPAPVRAISGAASLGFDPVTRTFLFAYSGAQRTEVVALDETGVQLWHAPAHVICNGIDAVLQVDAAAGRFYVTGTAYTCAGSTGTPVAHAFDADGGATLFDLALGEGGRPMSSWESSAACDLGCRHLFSQWFPSWEGVVRGRVIDTAAPFPHDGGFSLGVNAAFGGVDHTALASNGSEYFSMLAITNSATGSSTLQFQRHDGRQWLGSPVTMSGQRALPPHAIWTGDGWLIAASTYVLGTSYAFPSSHRDYSLELYHFAPDGTLRERRVFETHAYGGRLAWAGGRIAMTFSRVPANESETRHLVFFDCP